MKRPEYKVRNARGRSVHRLRPGTLALREIKFYQHTQVFLIAIKPFIRLCREFTRQTFAGKQKLSLPFNRHQKHFLQDIFQMST